MGLNLKWNTAEDFQSGLGSAAIAGIDWAPRNTVGVDGGAARSPGRPLR